MKFSKLFNNSIKAIFIGLFLWMVILILFFANNTDYACKKVFLISNITILIVWIICHLLKKWLPINVKKMDSINFDKVVKTLIPIFLLLQIYIFYLSYFETDWDPVILTNNAKLLISGKNIHNVVYYSNYPNNILITIIFSIILKINSLIGVFGVENELMSIIVINCIISTYVSYLIYKISKKLTNPKIAFWTYVLSLPLLVFSPWNMIYYSDALGLLFPIMILDIYLNSNKKYYYKYLLIFVLTYLGYWIKPQITIITIAIIMVEIVKFLSKVNVKKFKKALTVLLLTGAIIIPVHIGIHCISKSDNVHLDGEQEFGISHFLMMGSNNVTNGVWYREDVEASRKIKTSKERTAYNISTYKNRIHEYGVNGYLKLLSKKMLTNYNDGTFAWGAEGKFYIKIKEKPSKIATVFRNIYYNDGPLFPYYSTIMQVIWISMIFTILAKAVIKLFDKEIDYVYLMLTLTIIGLTVFELLFEARARYLYIYLPIYIILSIYNKRKGEVN